MSSQPERRGRLARSTAFFSIATGASRVAGLAREIVAAGYFGIKGPMSAFTIAFQLPNLVRMLFADAAIQAAFVPVFTQQLEEGRRREAFRLGATLIVAVIAALGLLTALFVLLAPLLIPLFAPGFEGSLEDLTVSLSRLLFPILILLGLAGIVVGILNSYDRFGALAIAPLFWNLVIIGVLVGLEPLFDGDDRIYAYAIGVLAGTAVQLVIVAYDLRNTPFRFRFEFDWRAPELRQVLILMVPVTISLGLINVNLLINSLFGTLVSDQAPAAIDKAFRIYMLPQGMFSVAVATVIFPTLARFAARRDFADLRATMANGSRLILLLLVPAAAAILALSEPMTQLVYERGEFDAAQTDVVAEALFWFAFALPFNGLFLINARTFFSLQRPWVQTWIALGNVAITALAALVLYSPFGVGGIVAATGIATIASVIAQSELLRRELGGLELRRMASAGVRIVFASALLALVVWGGWSLLDALLGGGLGAQIASVGAALTAGSLVYLLALRALGVPELDQLARLLRRSRSGSARPVVPDES